MASRMEKSLGTSYFPHKFLSSVMTGTEHELLTKLLKIKPATF